MIKRLCLISIASLTLALGLHLAGPISTSHAVAPIGPSATMKIGCPAKKAGAKTRRCPRNPNVVAAAVIHAERGWTFTATVRPASRRWQDQITRIEYTLGDADVSTLLVSLGWQTGKRRLTDSLPYPVQWETSEWAQVCSGHYRTTLKVVATTVAGRRSPVVEFPVDLTFGEWDLGGRAELFGRHTYMFCWSEDPVVSRS